MAGAGGPSTIAQITTLVGAAGRTSSRLRDFETVTGDQFPRAFSDTLNHIQSIVGDAKEIRTHLESNAFDPQQEQELARAVEVCNKQLQALNVILIKYMPDGPKGKITSRSLGDVYKEHDIPKIQKTLSGFETTFASYAGPTNLNLAPNPDMDMFVQA